jgi:hypothetical protein
MSRQFDGRNNTNVITGRDYINIYSQHTSSSSHRSLPPLSFNDAPIDLLSSHFTGRQNELDSIERIFGAVNGDAPARCVVFGMLGLGKTQLSLKYAVTSHQRRRYSLIFWISGATVEKLNQGLADVLHLVGHPDRDHPGQSTRLTSARRWFEECSAIRRTTWLLVLDNVTQESVLFLREHLPRQNSMGNILLTTRTRDVAEAMVSVAGQQHRVLELLAPDTNDAVKLLLKEAGIVTNHSAFTEAKELVECLGRLPLAISQAASFAKQSNKSLDYVLSLYQSKHRYEVGFSTFSSGCFFTLMFVGLAS